MYVRASSYFRDVRRAAGQPYETGKGAQDSSRPIEIAAVGYAGLIAILWLMAMKRF